MLKQIEQPTVPGIYYYKRRDWQLSRRAEIILKDRGDGEVLCVRWKVGLMPEVLEDFPEDAEWLEAVGLDGEGNEVRVGDFLDLKGTTSDPLCLIDVVGYDNSLCFTLDRIGLIDEKSLRGSAWVRVEPKSKD